MYIKKFEEGKSISVAIPLTKGTDKTRIKRRSILNEYGLPVATRSENITLDCYVEWQIGYDVMVKEEEKLKRSSLPDHRFIGANTQTKALYELSEYVYYFYKWNIISKNSLLKIKDDLSKIEDENLFEAESLLSIKRTHFVEKEFNGIPFFYSKVEYPILIHKFKNFEIITEILIKERQYAIGVQPMLYLCFPITELKSERILLGRSVDKNEEAEFIIDNTNYEILLNLLYFFGMLSKNHKKDIISIIDFILNNN